MEIDNTLNGFITCWVQKNSLFLLSVYLSRVQDSLYMHVAGMFIVNFETEANLSTNQIAYNY